MPTEQPTVLTVPRACARDGRRIDFAGRVHHRGRCGLCAVCLPIATACLGTTSSWTERLAYHRQSEGSRWAHLEDIQAVG